jgi:hypothetical protein
MLYQLFGFSIVSCCACRGENHHYCPIKLYQILQNADDITFLRNFADGEVDFPATNMSPPKGLSL